ncbi:MAG: hypothetical protein ACI9QV_001459 [Methylophagaceae bacterium]|jgi:hypothetical protein
MHLFYKLVNLAAVLTAKELRESNHHVIVNGLTDRVCAIDADIERSN